MNNKSIYFKLNEKLYNTNLVQLDKVSLYKKDGKYYTDILFKNFSEQAISKVNILMNIYEKQKSILKEDVLVSVSMDDSTIELEGEGITSISCSIVSVVVDDEVIDYNDFEIFYLDRKRKFKDQYTEKEIECIQFLNKSNIEITRESFIPCKVNQFGIDYNGDLILVENNEDMFKYMDWVSSSIEAVCDIACYQRAVKFMGERSVEGYKQASILLSNCLGYEDAYELKEFCDEQSFEIIYQDALAHFNQQDKDGFEEALVLFKSIEGYRDTNEYINQCSEKIDLLNEQFNKQIKRYGLIASIVLVVSSIFLIVYYVQTHMPYIYLKEKHLELGETLVLNKNDYIVKDKCRNVEELDFILETDLMDSKDFTYDKGTHEVKTKDGEFLPVGEYEVVIRSTNNKAKNTTKIIVEDTTPPRINTKPVNYEIGDEKVMYNKFFEIQDYSVCKFDLDDSKVDLTKEGSYTVKVTATDEYGNSASKELKVFVSKGKRIFYVGTYMTYGAQNVWTDLSYSDTNGVVPAGSLVIINNVYEAPDGSYWGVLSNGYILLADANFDYMYWYDNIYVSRDEYDSDEEFETACGIKIPACEEDEGNYGNLNYKQTCSGCIVFY